MAIKKWYLSRKVLIEKGAEQAVINFDKWLDLKAYIQSIINLNNPPVISADNGLTYNSLLNPDTVELGGTLNRTTTIDGDALTYSLNLSELENLTTDGTFFSANFTDTIGFFADTFNVQTLNRNILTSPINEIYSSTSLKLVTPDVIAGIPTPLRSVLTLIDGTGDCEFTRDRYIQGFFSGSSWTAQQITILQTTHLRGTIPMIQVCSNAGAVKTVLNPLGPGNPLVSITTNALGDVTLTCTAGMEFTGQVLII